MGEVNAVRLAGIYIPGDLFLFCHILFGKNGFVFGFPHGFIRMAVQAGFGRPPLQGGVLKMLLHVPLMIEDDATKLDERENGLSDFLERCLVEHEVVVVLTRAVRLSGSKKYDLAGD